MAELDTKELAVLEKVRKLMTLAADGGATQAEAESATGLAMRLLEAYNLDMTQVEAASKSGTAKRSDQKKAGGLYQWQRSLWEAVAKLNFCMYWPLKEWDETKENQYERKRGNPGVMGGWTFRHRVLGRHSNVVSTQVMADYLEGAIERLTRARYSHNIWAKEATSFREGMTAAITRRLNEKRAEAVKAEQERHYSGAGAHAGALVLASVIQAEQDANDDYLYGEGYSQRQRDQRAAADAAYQERMAKQKEWDAEHPEEAAERDRKSKEWWENYSKECEAKREAAERRRAKNPPKERPVKRYKGDTHAFYSGYSEGEKVGLDKQVDQNPRPTLIK